MFAKIFSRQSSSSSSPFTPCGAQGIQEELPGFAISSYSLDLIPWSSCSSSFILYCPLPHSPQPTSSSVSLRIPFQCCFLYEAHLMLEISFLHVVIECTFMSVSFTAHCFLLAFIKFSCIPVWCCTDKPRYISQEAYRLCHLFQSEKMWVTRHFRLWKLDSQCPVPTTYAVYGKATLLFFKMKILTAKDNKITNLNGKGILIWTEDQSRIGFRLFQSTWLLGATPFRWPWEDWLYFRFFRISTHILCSSTLSIQDYA